MKFSIVVYSPPYSSEAASTAFNFARALLEQGHEIYRLFFFSDGVHNANRLATVGHDEINLQQQWNSLISDNNLDSVVCVSSALKRGIIDQTTIDQTTIDQTEGRHELKATTLYDSSEIAGLGQLVDAAVNSDRLMNFG